MGFNTIKLKKYLDIINEYTATAVAITPGMLIELTSANLVQAHSNEGQNVLPMFALEDELQGKGIDDNYAASDKIQCWVAVRGEEVYAILEDGETIVIGDFLESNGAGLLQKHSADVAEGASSNEAVEDLTIYTNQIVGIALEAVDLSTSSGEASSEGPGLESSVDTLGYNRRIKIRIK